MSSATPAPDAYCMTCGIDVVGAQHAAVGHDVPGVSRPQRAQADTFEAVRYGLRGRRTVLMTVTAASFEDAYARFPAVERFEQA